MSQVLLILVAGIERAVKEVERAGGEIARTEMKANGRRGFGI